MKQKPIIIKNPVKSHNPYNTKEIKKRMKELAKSMELEKIPKNERHR